MPRRLWLVFCFRVTPPVSLLPVRFWDKYPTESDANLFCLSVNAALSPDSCFWRFPTRWFPYSFRESSMEIRTPNLNPAPTPHTHLNHVMQPDRLIHRQQLMEAVLPRRANAQPEINLGRTIVPSPSWRDDCKVCFANLRCPQSMSGRSSASRHFDPWGLLPIFRAAELAPPRPTEPSRKLQ